MSVKSSQLGHFKLDGEVALITGAAGLLGFQHAHALLESGATVILTDINQDALARRQTELTQLFSSERVIIKVLDVTDHDDVSRVNATLVKDELYVNILINNAAIDPKVSDKSNTLETSRLENFSLAQWDVELNVGLKGAFICSQVFGLQMAKRGRGVILNIASDLSVFSPDQRIYRKSGLSEDKQPVKPVTYSVIKTGLVGLTRYLATYWADQGVRANSLSPGGVYVDQDASFVSKLTELIPQKRMAGLDEYKGAIQFLCSDASKYMNGQNIVMDGGRSVW